MALNGKLPMETACNWYKACRNAFFFFSLEIVHYEVDRLIVNKQLGVYEVAVKAA